MKKLFPSILSALAIGLALFPSGAFADRYDFKVRSIDEFPTYTGASATGDYTFMWDVSANKVVKIDATTQTLPTSVDTHNTVYSTALTGNPLAQGFYKDLTVSTDITSTAMTTLIASTAGRTLHVHDMKIMVSGTAASATALAIECSDGTLLASWPIADLITLKPIGIGLYNSTLSTITTGAGLGTGCPASTALMLSNVGTAITTTTHVYPQGTYTVQ